MLNGNFNRMSFYNNCSFIFLLLFFIACSKESLDSRSAPQSTAIINGVSQVLCLGGTADERAIDIKSTPDGGFVLLSSTNSSDGDLSGMRAGGDDLWIVKCNSMMQIEWSRTLGGYADEDGVSILVDFIGNIYAGLNTISNDGDFSGNLGGTDAVLVKYNSNGVLLYKRHLGSSGDDMFDVLALGSNGNVLGLGSGSGDFDISGSSAGYARLFELDANTGQVLWCVQCPASDNAKIIQDLNQNIYCVAEDFGNPLLFKFSSGGQFLFQTQLSFASSIYDIKMNSQGVFISGSSNTNISVLPKAIYGLYSFSGVQLYVNDVSNLVPLWSSNLPYIIQWATGGVYNGNGFGEIAINCVMDVASLFFITSSSIKGYQIDSNTGQFFTPAIYEIDGKNSIDIVVSSAILKNGTKVLFGTTNSTESVFVNNHNTTFLPGIGSTDLMLIVI